MQEKCWGQAARRGMLMVTRNPGGCGVEDGTWTAPSLATRDTGQTRYLGF